MKITTTFLFKEDKSTFDHRLNYKMSQMNSRTIPIGIKVSVVELVVTLNRSKLTPGFIIRET